MIARLQAACAASIVSVLLGLWFLPAEAREFRAVDIYPGDYPSVQAVLQMDRLLRKSSDQRFGITMLGRDEHQTEADNVALLREGRLDMARVNVTALDTN